jgi:cell division septum initiation protein DivIVA
MDSKEGGEMSKPTITSHLLIDHRACTDQVALFRKTFGESVVVTVARARTVAGPFNWEWAARNLLDGTARAEYERVRSPARAEYERVEALAGAEYERVTGQARAEYERVTGQARAEYERVTGQARAEYERVRGQAWAECERAQGQAFAAAFIEMWKRMGK